VCFSVSDPLLDPFPVRLAEAQMETVERLRERMSKRASGARISRSEVLRLAVELGLKQLELDHTEEE
jgi:hypothetical protein